MSKGSSETKKEKPTARRLREARRRGQVPKSVELSGALSLLCTLLCVISLAPWAAKHIADFGLAVDRSFEALTLETVQIMTLEGLWLMTKLSLIPMGVAALVYLVTLWLQTGPVLSLELVKPQLERINPVEGAKRLFSLRSLVQFVMMLIKSGIIAAAALLVCFNVLGDAIRVIYADAGAALTVANAALMQLLLWCGGLFVLLGLLDLLYQRWQYMQDMRMSSSEVRREQRDDQGSGELKSQRKSFAKDPVPRDQLAFMHLASLVVRDTDGRAVALVYRPKQHPVPLCLVRGNGDFGLELLSSAQLNKVPIVTDTALLAAIYPGAHTGAPILAKHLDTVLGHLPRSPA
jgi:flagellar biosynthesis protein FlhB